MNKILYKEEQRYKKPRINYIITAVVVMLIIDITFIVRSMFQGEGEENTVLMILTVVLTGVTVGFVLIFTRLKMITFLSEAGIQVFYPPFRRKGRLSIAKEEIEKYEIRQYNPLIEYGGWGIKPRGRFFRRKRSGLAYTAYGRTGLQLYLRGGKKILIGTQRPEPLKHAMAKMLPGEDEKTRVQEHH